MRSDRPSKQPAAVDARAARRLRRELLRYLTARLGDAALAEDLTQETLIRVLRPPSARRTLTPRALRIAERLAAEHEEREAPWRKGELVALPDESLVRDPGTPTPHELLEQRIARDCLVGAFGRLPIDARRLIMLHDLAEIPLREIAATFGCSATSAKVRLRRARIRLSEICRAEGLSELGPDVVMVCLQREGAPLASQGGPPRRRGVRRPPRRRAGKGTSRKA